MIKRKCPECKKVLEGYTERHLDTLLAQHVIKHRNDEKNDKA